MENASFVIQIITDGEFLTNIVRSLVQTGEYLLNNALKINIAIDIIGNGLLIYFLKINDMQLLAEHVNKEYSVVVYEKDFLRRLKGKCQNPEKFEEQTWQISLIMNNTEFSDEEIIVKLFRSLNQDSYYGLKKSKVKNSKKVVIEVKTIPIMGIISILTMLYKTKILQCHFKT